MNNITEQSDGLWKSTRESSKCNFLVAINGILREVGDGVDGSLFADDLAIYITTRNQRVAIRALQELPRS